MMQEHEAIRSEYWGILEAMGRTVRYGRIEEVVRAGHLFFRVHIPDTTANYAFVEEYGAGSIFRITRAEQPQVRALAEANNRYELHNSKLADQVLKQIREQLETALYDDNTDGIPF